MHGHQCADDMFGLDVGHDAGVEALELLDQDRVKHDTCLAPPEAVRFVGGKVAPPGLHRVADEEVLDDGAFGTQRHKAYYSSLGTKTQMRFRGSSA